MPNDPYSPIAHYYALEQSEQNDDLPFFLELARETGGPVLDLGAGDARIAASLAMAGYAVTALDSSAAMLALAKARIPQPLSDRVTLLHGDMQSFRTTDAFGLAVCATGTFAHITDTEGQLKALRAVKRCLKPGGLLALVLQNPYQLVVDPPAGELVVQWRGIDPATGATVTKLVTNEAELAEQLLHAIVAYDVVTGDGTLRRYETEFPLRWTYQPELDLLLRRAGFTPHAYYGDYDMSSYESHSPLLIAVTQI